MRRKSILFALAFLLVLVQLTTGCARTTTTRTVHPAASNTVVVEETTVVHDDEGSPVGSVFHVLGEIIAFPFRLVGNLFSAIF